MTSFGNGHSGMEKSPDPFILITILLIILKKKLNKQLKQSSRVDMLRKMEVNYIISFFFYFLVMYP